MTRRACIVGNAEYRGFTVVSSGKGVTCGVKYEKRYGAYCVPVTS